MLKVLKILVSRFTAETPIFFKWLRNAAAIFGTSCASALAANHYVMILPPMLCTVLGYCICASAFVAGTSQFARKDDIAPIIQQPVYTPPPIQTPTTTGQAPEEFPSHNIN